MKQFLAALLFALMPALAWADNSPTAISTACGVSGGPLYAVGTLSASIARNPQTGSSYALPAAATCGAVTIRSNSGTAMTDTLPAAATYGAGWLRISNTDSAATDTVSGGFSAVLQPGQSILLTSDGTAWSQAGGTFGAALGTGGNVINAQSASYTILSSDCGKTVTETGGPFLIALPAVTGFPATCAVVVCNDNANSGTTHAVTLSSFPAGLLPRLYQQQCAGVAIQNGAWQATYAPGRFRPAFLPTLYIDTANGNDGNDGLVSNASGNALATVQRCITVFQTEYDFVTRQPVCSLTGGQTFGGGLAITGPFFGTSVVNIVSTGSQATIQAAAAATSVGFLGDFAPYVITTGVTWDCSTGATNCNAFFFHQQTGADLNSGTIIKGGNASNIGIACDSVCKVNISSDGVSAITFTGSFSQGIVANLGSIFAISKGIAVANSTTFASTIVQANSNSNIQYSGVLTAGTSVSAGEIFTLRGNSAACISGFTTSGTFTGARQFSVLNGAQLANISAVAIPGSAGIVTATGFSAGFAPNGSGGNTGVSAAGC